MSAHVSLNLLNALSKKIICRASYRFSPTSLIVSIIEEREGKILFVIWHLNRIIAPKRHDFAIRKCDVLMNVNA